MVLGKGALAGSLSRIISFSRKNLVSATAKQHSVGLYNNAMVASTFPSLFAAVAATLPQQKSTTKCRNMAALGVSQHVQVT